MLSNAREEGLSKDNDEERQKDRRGQFCCWQVFRVKAFVWQLSDKIHGRRGSCVGQSLSGTGIVLELEQEIRIV